ncbi:IclR family transcriptional regulator [Xenophilus sp.]|uniref:IclR family transcriptional regulator n=1 Tax=Xenophilus sp. TaxID=1873499 RepID=UPI0037DDB03B
MGEMDVESRGGDRQFATTLARGLEILRCFTPERPVLGNRELADLTGLSKPTISRFSYTLTELGYLRVDRTSGKYQLGTAVLTLSYPLLANIPLRQVVRPQMRELAERLGGSVSLCMRERLKLVYVETSRSRSLRAQRYSDIGMSHPIIATANGRAYLAACTAEERTTLLNEIRVKTPDHWLKWGAAAEEMMAFCQDNGFAYSHGEYRPDVATVGVPYRPATGGELYVFNCVLASYAVKPGQLEREVGPALLAMVADLSYV